MSAPTTPDRAALAERLRAWIAKDAPALVVMLTDLGHDIRDAAAALAAPALPPSVAEARERVVAIIGTAYAEQGGADLAEVEHVDALIAAVRAATPAVPDDVRAAAARVQRALDRVATSTQSASTAFTGDDLRTLVRYGLGGGS